MAVSVSVSPTTIQPGGLLTVSVTGLGANEPYNITMVTGTATALFTGTSDGSGNLNKSYVVAAALQGTCTLTVADALWTDGSTTFTVVGSG